MPIPGLVLIGFLFVGVVAFAEGCASEWRNPKSARAKILIIGGGFFVVVAVYMIKNAVLGR